MFAATCWVLSHSQYMESVYTPKYPDTVLPEKPGCNLETIILIIGNTERRLPAVPLIVYIYIYI